MILLIIIINSIFLWQVNSSSLHKDKKASSETLKLRSFLNDKARLWPNAVIPYEVDPSFNNWEKKKIGKALKLFQSVSCLRFVPHSTQKDFIRYTKSSSSCSSPLGRLGGRQEIFLKDDCFYLPKLRGSILHETMHSLGFIHEHQRTDRDCYILVDEKAKKKTDLQIIPGTENRFPYDIHSIMHYKQHPYLKGKRGEKIGNQQGTLTDLDKQKLNYLYCKKPHYCNLHPRECADTEIATKSCRIKL